MLSNSLRVFLVVCVSYSAVFLAGLSISFNNGLTSNQSVAPGADAAEYVSLARTMIESGRFAMTPESGPEYFRTPGYPFFLAVLLGVFGSVAVIPFAQTALVGFSCALIYLLGIRYFSSVWIGLGASILYALNPSVITTAYTSLSDTLFVFLMLLAVYCLGSSGWRWLVVGALVSGLMVLTRPLGLYLLPFLFLLPLIHTLPNWKKGLQKVGICIVISGLILAPWVVRNYLLSGHLALSSLSSYNILFFNVLEFESQGRGVAKEDIRQEFYNRLGTDDWIELRSFRYAEAESFLTKEYLGPYLLEYSVFHAVKTVPFFVASSIEAGDRALYAFGIKSGEVPPDINISNLFVSGRWGEGFKALAHNWPELFERVFWLLCWIGAGGMTVYALIKRLPYAGVYVALFLLCLAVAALAGPLAMPRYRLPAEPFLFLLAMQGGIVVWQRLISLYDATRARHY